MKVSQWDQVRAKGESSSQNAWLSSQILCHRMVATICSCEFKKQPGTFREEESIQNCNARFTRELLETQFAEEYSEKKQFLCSSIVLLLLPWYYYYLAAIGLGWRWHPRLKGPKVFVLLYILSPCITCRSA